MRKNPPRTYKMEPTAPKVLSRYLSAPTTSCHDHCKCATKESTETKPTNLFPRRVPKMPPNKTKVDATNSVNKIKRAPSVIPKVTTRNVKNNTVVKDRTLKRDGFPISTKKDVVIEPKGRDLKQKSENFQSKKYNPPNLKTSSRRHSEIFLPNLNMPHPSSRVLPKRRLSEIGIHPKKDVVSVSNTSLVRGSRNNKNEPRKDSKHSIVNKQSSSIKPTVPSLKRGEKVSTLKSYKSLPQLEHKSPRKSKPKKTIEEVVPENTLHVVEPKNGVETIVTETSNILDYFSSSEEKVMTHDHNKLDECLPPMDDDTTATDGQNSESPNNSEVTDTKDATQVEKLVVETKDCSCKTESDITPDSSPISEEKVLRDGNNELLECSQSIEDDTTTTGGQYNHNITDSKVIDTKEAIQVGKLVTKASDCSQEDLVFRRGKVLSPHSEGNSPRNLQFKQGKELDENETEKVEEICLGRMSFDGAIHVPESHSVNVELKHQEMEEKGSPQLFNKVLEETAYKLIQTRKSKVKALVGAFENIVSSTNKTP